MSAVLRNNSDVVYEGVAGGEQVTVDNPDQPPWSIYLKRGWFSRVRQAQRQAPEASAAGESEQRQEEKAPPTKRAARSRRTTNEKGDGE